MGERTFDDFDGHAKDYRSIHSENIRLSGADSFYFAAMKVNLLKQYEHNETLKLLDVGCGDGVTEDCLHMQFPNWQLWGADVSTQSIEEAKSKHIPACEFINYDGNQLPFNTNTFDIVYMANVLHHVDRSLHNKLITEIRRVLKPGGRFYLFEHNPLNPVTRYFVRTCAFDKDAVLLRYSYTKQLLLNNGLNECRKKFILFFPRKGVWKWILPIEKLLSWIPLGGQYYYRAKKMD